ncbi:hypothetical protein D3C84_1104320 [compost metagenome]
MVSNATTPPSASEPYSALPGPRTTSTRLSVSRSTKLRLAVEKLPIENASGTAMPSVSMRTRLPPRPRMRMSPRPKRPVPVVTVMPGS